MDKEKLKQTITELTEIVKELDLAINEEVIFEQACTFVRGELANSNKNIDVSKPTEKQINLLRKNRIKINPELTKQEATQIIKELIEKRR